MYSLPVIDQDRVQRAVLVLQLLPSQDEDAVAGVGQPKQEAGGGDRRHADPISIRRVILASETTHTQWNHWCVCLSQMMNHIYIYYSFTCKKYDDRGSSLFCSSTNSPPATKIWFSMVTRLAWFLGICVESDAT